MILLGEQKLQIVLNHLYISQTADIILKSKFLIQMYILLFFKVHTKFPKAVWKKKTETSILLFWNRVGENLINQIMSFWKLHSALKFEKKCNFKSAKKHYLHFQKWQKINFWTRKKFKSTKNVILGLFPSAKIDFFCHFWKCT